MIVLVMVKFMVVVVMLTVMINNKSNYVMNGLVDSNEDDERHLQSLARLQAWGAVS